MAPVTSPSSAPATAATPTATGPSPTPAGPRVVAVAEPRDPRRARFAARHQLPPGAAVAELGYHLLLEKPMATTEAGCRRIVEAVERAGVLFAVCHVLRYTPDTALVSRWWTRAASAR